MKVRLLLIIYIIGVLTSCHKSGGSGAGADGKDVPEHIADLHGKMTDYLEKIKAADSVGVCVYDLTADEMVYGYRESEPMSSASCLKLLTGMAALRELGSGCDFHTTFEQVGTLQADTLRGTLLVRGDIDPLLNDTDVVNAAEALVEQGISVVRDTICLSFPEDDGLSAEAHWVPGDIKARQRGVNAYPHDARERHILGALQEGGLKTPGVKIIWQEKAKEGKVLYDVRHTLNQVVWAMWNHSSNVRSEGLLTALALHNKLGKPYRENGLRSLKAFLEDKVPQYASEAELHDGCGLCIENRMSPRLLCALLCYGWRTTSVRHELLRDLPVSGLRGTLVKEMRNSAARGHIMAKTGTLSRNGGVTSTAGFCKSRDGHMLAFVILAAPYPTSEAHRMRAKICEILISTDVGKDRKGNH